MISIANCHMQLPSGAEKYLINLLATNVPLGYRSSDNLVQPIDLYRGKMNQFRNKSQNIAKSIQFST
jgi:hypothetical protein